MKDWLIRALKTFVQTFLGVLLPEFCVVLKTGVPEGSSMWAMLAPVLTAALSAAISAVWNWSLQTQTKPQGKETEDK